MQPGASTFPCPNCGRPLPAHARFCGDCGKAVAQPSQAAMPAAQPVFPSPTLPPAQAAQPIFPSPTPAAMPHQGEMATVIDPNFQPLPLSQARVPAAPTPVLPPLDQPVSAPAWPAAQPQAPGPFSAPTSGFQVQAPTAYGLGSQPPASGQYQSAPPAQLPSVGEFPKRRSFLSQPIGKIALFFLAIAVIGGGIGIYFIIKGISASASSPLPNTVPLPANNSFVKNIDQTWYYTVSNTTPQQVQSFYQTELPKKGWSEPDATTTQQSTVILACKADQEVNIISDSSTSLGDVSPPSGGVVLKIVLKPPVPADCATQ